MYEPIRCRRCGAEVPGHLVEQRRSPTEAGGGVDVWLWISPAVAALIAAAGAVWLFKLAGML